MPARWIFVAPCCRRLEARHASRVVLVGSQRSSGHRVPNLKLKLLRSRCPRESGSGFLFLRSHRPQAPPLLYLNFTEKSDKIRQIELGIFSAFYVVILLPHLHSRRMAALEARRPALKYHANRTCSGRIERLRMSGDRWSRPTLVGSQLRDVVPLPRPHFRAHQLQCSKHAPNTL